MDVDLVLLTGLDRFGWVLEHLTPENSGAPSPCTDWTAKDVAGHVLTVLNSAVTTLGGAEFDWKSAPDPATSAGEDPHSRFFELSTAAREALPEANLDQVMTTGLGELTIRQRLTFSALDLHLHAWDLGRALGEVVELDEPTIEFARATYAPLPDEMKRQASVFGAAVEAPADATPTEELMAWCGRQVR